MKLSLTPTALVGTDTQQTQQTFAMLQSNCLENQAQTFIMEQTKKCQLNVVLNNTNSLEKVFNQ